MSPCSKYSKILYAPYIYIPYVLPQVGEIGKIESEARSRALEVKNYLRMYQIDVGNDSCEASEVRFITCIP